MIVILMGVSGSGKTTIGTLLAERTHAVFADADDFHPPGNKAKMAAGIPLTDEDRQPWLEELNRLLQRWAASATSGVLACSALKAKYRATLESGIPTRAIAFIWLDGSKELLTSRLAARHHEYMSTSLLESQLDTLEPPPDGYRIVNDEPPADIVDHILRTLEDIAN